MKISPSLKKNRVKTFFLATRPAFLTLTAIGCLLGVSTARWDGFLAEPLLIIGTLLAALLLHAGANVFNDYADARNGTDARNISAVRPFTGGSLFIQKQLLTENETLFLGYGLFLSAGLIGLLLAWKTTPAIFIFGGIGALIGWAYSLNPIRLMSRGWGEIGVITAWIFLVMGADFVFRKTFSLSPFYAGFPFAVLVGNLLFVNEIPDIAADKASQKRNLVVQYGLRKSRILYGLFIIVSSCSLLAFVAYRKLPPYTLWAETSAVLLVIAWAQLLSSKTPKQKQLEIAIKLTLLAVHLQGLLLIAGFFFS